jgi:hypothetical protein
VVGRIRFALERFGSPRHSSHVAQLVSLDGVALMRCVILFVAVTFLAVGCHTHSKRTVEQFDFLELGMSMTVVSNRVGVSELPCRGQIRWRYSLADGSEMFIIARPEREPYTFETWRVVRYGQSRDGKWLWTKPPDY